MRIHRPARALAGLVLGTLAFAAPAAADVKITGHAYVRHDGGTDATIASCSDRVSPAATAGGNRQANEPAASVDPMGSGHMTAGANEYCTLPTTTDVWAGFYYSPDGGANWTDSLLPGYPTDTSTAGQASPLFGLVTAAGDPVQAWNNNGGLYYGGIAFNRTHPNNGSIWVARYTWPLVATAPTYEYTTIVSRGTPGFGHFEDKVQLEVDKGASSAHAGNVYLCWARFTGSPANNFVYVARSTDGARSFSVQKISAGVHGSQFCDIAVTRNGTVFVAWRQYAFMPTKGQQQRDAVAWVKSTDGGRTFTRPAVAAEFLAWDPGDEFGSPAAAGRAYYQACLNADATIGACLAGPEPRQNARDCGDGPFACQSGYVFFRANTQVRIAADPTAAGNPDAAYVVFDASVPGSETPTGTTYGTAGTGVGTQASVYLVKTENGGGSWTPAARIDPQAVGHQFFPDIDADNGRLHAVWQDSRNDCASGPPGTVGDFRTVPIANDWTAANPPGGIVCSAAPPTNPGAPGVDAVYATSTDGGASWASSIVSAARTMPPYEQFGNRDVPFFGDYNYIDAGGARVLMAWTDQRDTVAGIDPRYPLDGMDGFDVHQCRAPVEGGFGPDTCPNAGGLDQNIYGFAAALP
jgi:hypothetical protein